MGMIFHHYPPGDYISPEERISEPQEGTSEVQIEGIALSQYHTKELAFSEGITIADVARHIYTDSEQVGPGLHKEWGRLTAGEDHEHAFLQAYAGYLLQPSMLRQDYPDRYAFLKEHVFDSAEYPREVPQGELPIPAYLDHDSLGRQIQKTPDGRAWVVATGERIA